MYFIKKYKKGIFNKYSAKKDKIDIFLKDTSYLIRKIYFFFANGFKNKNILIYPHYPGRKAGMFQLAKKLNYNLTNKIPKKYELAVYWEYETFRKEFELIDKISKHKKVINLKSRDISKKKVDEVFTKIFGYSSLVNPLEFEGKCVKKGDINGLHNGQIITCPIEKTDENYIYQRIIETTNEENMTTEVRVAIINDKIPYCLMKHKTKDDLFSVGFNKSKLINEEDFFTKEEIQLILKFCKEFNFEFGELDIMRDDNNGKIYIIDTNNTPQQRLGKDKNTKKTVYNNLAKIFKEEFISSR
ncbi:MAG: hypothetical protein JXL97_02655 [Bacteroidales bacterium]|nr:hypothetical protein [Bacteroidales bacterium]